MSLLYLGIFMENKSCYNVDRAISGLERDTLQIACCFKWDSRKYVLIDKCILNSLRLSDAYMRQ